MPLPLKWLLHRQTITTHVYYDDPLLRQYPNFLGKCELFFELNPPQIEPRFKFHVFTLSCLFWSLVVRDKEDQGRYGKHISIS